MKQFAFKNTKLDNLSDIIPLAVFINRCGNQGALAPAVTVMQIPLQVGGLGYKCSSQEEDQDHGVADSLSQLKVLVAQGNNPDKNPAELIPFPTW